jgi:hypothetical protein
MSRNPGRTNQRSALILAANMLISGCLGLKGSS